MNIILTNFADGLDKFAGYGLIGAPVGIISSVATMDNEDDLIDSVLSGGIGGIVGGAAGGLISQENIYGPGIGAIIGGSVARKLTRGKSIKNLAKDIYYETKSLKEDPYIDNYGFSNFNNVNNTEKAISNNQKIESKREEIDRLKEENIELKGENLDIEKEHLQKSNITPEVEEIYGKPKDLNEYTEENIVNENEISKNKELISDNNKKISDLNKDISKLSNSSNNSTNLRSETVKDVSRDLMSSYKTANNYRSNI